MNSSPSKPGRTLGRPRRLEFKADRPRQIDRYIDYFGNGTASSAATSLEHYAASTLERIEKSGAAGLLRKPFDAPAVLDAIRRAVRANHERNAGAGGGGPAPAVTASVDELGG